MYSPYTNPYAYQYKTIRLMLVIGWRVGFGEGQYYNVIPLATEFTEGTENTKRYSR